MNVRSAMDERERDGRTTAAADVLASGMTVDATRIACRVVAGAVTFNVYNMSELFVNCYNINYIKDLINYSL